MTNVFKLEKGDSLRKKPAIDDNKNYAYNSMMVSGVKNRFHSAEGFDSALQSSVYKKRLEKYRDALGDGTLNLVAVDKNGNLLNDGKPINIDGREFYPNAKGQYTFLNKFHLEEMTRNRKEVEEYIDMLVDNVVSDESLAYILNMDVEDVMLFCRANSPEFAGLYPNAPKAIQETDCSPSVINVLHPNTREYGMGVSKLRMIIRAYCPIIKDMNTAKVVREETA